MMKQTKKLRITDDLEAASPASLLVANPSKADCMDIVCDGSFSSLSSLILFVATTFGSTGTINEKRILDKALPSSLLIKRI